MDVSPVQRNTQQLALANIQDYLKGNVCLKEYCKRKRFCDSLDTKLTQTSITLCGMEPHTKKPQQGLQRNSATGLVEEAAISPASSDSAYSSLTPSPPRHYSQDPIYSASFQDNTIETTGSPFCHASTTTSQTQQAKLGVEKEPTKRKANRPSVCYSHNKRTAINGDSDEVDSARPPKKKRNRGPKPRVMYEGKGPIQLWQLILQLLVSPPLGIEPKILEWTQEEKYGFRILKPEVLAKLWGELKQKPAMNFDKLSRGLRYYYNKSMLRKVAGKENTYEFTWDISEIIGYDPVHDPSKRLHTSDTLHALSASTSVSTSPLIDPLDDFKISSIKADSFPLSSSSAVLPVSVPVDIPVSKPQNEFAFCNRPEEPSVPVEGFWLPFIDAGDWQSVSSTDQLLEPSLIIPPPLLDFTTLIQSDQKSNFYEVL